MKVNWQCTSERRGGGSLQNAAKDHIIGYSIANDVTARDLQRRDGQWIRAKGFDTFCPIGPWIETEFNPFDAIDLHACQWTNAANGIHKGYDLFH